jgi:sec-independent protein translocase protein TatA
MFGIGNAELLILLVVLVVLFGGSQVPKLARSVGRARHEFEQGQRGS